MTSCNDHNMLTEIGLLFPSVWSIGHFSAETKNCILTVIHTVVKIYLTLGLGPTGPLDFQRKRNNAIVLKLHARGVRMSSQNHLS